MKKNRPIIVVAGPTASGKSDFAVELALKENGEIISADSRQIYKGLDIGTGKIKNMEMRGVPHHMLDICDITDDFSVAKYQRLALPILENIFARGKTPIICGGTGQYIDAIIYKNAFPNIPPDEKYRKRLEKFSTEELYKKLSSLDKRRAENIDKHNRVRLIRALEIIHKNGTVPELQKNILRYPITMYILSPVKEKLIENIDKRLEKRLKEGMTVEAENLFSYNFSDKKIATLGLEYKWMNKYLKKECSYDEMKKNILTSSWQYAKRQITWNKKYENFAKKIII